MDSEKEGLKIQQKKPSFIISIRFLLAILVFFGYSIQYAQKIDMSVSVVCMINHTAVALQSRTEQNSELLIQANHTAVVANAIGSENKCAFENQISSLSDGEFVWSRKIQGFVLGSYFYGYLITEIPGGVLSWKFGAKNVLLVAILGGSIGTFLTPIAAQFHYGYLIAVRFLTGLVHGLMWPAVATIWSHWAVPAERSLLISIGNAGSQIGNVVALPLGGYLCANGFAGGWPSIFYVFGIIGMVWCILWLIFVSDTPQTHKMISETERNYIEDSLTAKSENQKVPWKKIMTTKACFGVFTAHFASNSGIYLMLTNIPTYMKDVLKFDIKSNGILSALPYIVFWFVIVASGAIGDKLIRSKKLSRTTVRKIFNTIGFLIPMVSLIGLSFVRCDLPYLGVALLVVGLASNGFAYGSGFLVNFNDIGGSYAGILFGISNTFGSLPGILLPYLVGFITSNRKAEEWQIVFLITAGVYLIGAIVFLIFGSANLQTWVLDRNSKKEQENEPLKRIEKC